MAIDSELADLEYTWLDRLSPLRRAGISLRGMPNRPKEYGETQNQGQIALVFTGRDFIADISPYEVVQSTEVTNFKLDIRLREMRSLKERDGTPLDGSQYILKEVLNLVLATRIRGYQTTKVSSLRFTGESEDFWVYELNFNLQRIISIPVTEIDLLNAENILIGSEFDKPLPLASDGSLTIVTGLFISEVGLVGEIPPSVKVDEISIKLGQEDLEKNNK